MLAVIENKPLVAWKVDLSSGKKIPTESFFMDQFSEALGFVNDQALKDDPSGYWFILTHWGREIYRPDIPLPEYPLRLVVS